MAAGGSTGISAKSVYIPLNQKTHIKDIEIIFGEPVAASDILNIDIRSDEDEAENTDGSTWGIVSGANAFHVDRKRVTVRASKTNVENIQLVLTFDGGNPKIKTINIHGTEMTD